MRVLVIDGNNLVHRVYWIAKNQTRREKYFHVYLFLACVKSYIQAYSPQKVFCVWDEKQEKNINPRYILYPGYKQNRNTEHAKEVHKYNFLIYGLLKSLGIQNVYPHCYEADDVISIICNKINTDDNEFRVITADKDLCQLICKNIEIYDPIKKDLYTHTNFKEKLKYSINDFLFTKAVLGDKSDNIEGVKGIGIKKLQKVLLKEIQLTQEQESIVFRNLAILDLKNVLTCDTEVQHVLRQINSVTQINKSVFKEICSLCRFTHILEKFDIWLEEFIIYKNDTN